MAAKKKGAKKSSTRSRSKKTIRIDLMVDAQNAIVKRVGEFVEDAADMTMKGVFSPSAWLKRSARMWQNMAADLAKVANRL